MSILESVSKLNVPKVATNIVNNDLFQAKTTYNKTNNKPTEHMVDKTKYIILNKHIFNNDFVPKEIKDSWDKMCAHLKTPETSNQTTIDFFQSLESFMIDQGGVTPLEAPSEHFALPLPNGLSITYGSEFNTSELTLEQTLLNGVIRSVGTVAPNLANIFTDMVDFAANVLKRHGATINTHILNVYNGASLRNINMSFILIPQNKTEYNYYKETINKLKQYSLANKKTIAEAIPFLSQRNLFTFGWGGSSEETMYEIFNEVLMIGYNPQKVTPGFFINSINAHYGDNNNLLTEDGTPKVIRLDISFVERGPLYSDIIAKLCNLKIS